MVAVDEDESRWTGIAADRGEDPGRGQPHEAREDPNLNPGQAARIRSQHPKAPLRPMQSELSAPPILPITNAPLTPDKPPLTQDKPCNPGQTLPNQIRSLALSTLCRPPNECYRFCLG